MPIPQPITTPHTGAAIFLTLTISPDAEAPAVVRDFCSALSGLVRTTGSREPEAGLTCVMGIGSNAWNRLFSGARPAELHPFREFRSGSRHAMATPGDLLFHIRATRPDLCFELAALIMTSLGGAVSVEDEVHGFRYFDCRDLTGFVDGTENPQGQEAIDATLIGDEDPVFAAGSYVIVQKYLHHREAWEALPTEQQERIIGRTKLQNVELDDATKPSWAHNALTVIEEDGEEKAILRENMPFGRPGHGEFGTYFIGYCRTPRITELMIENMFVGRPPGNYDRLLDFTHPVTGCLFFVPPATFLDAVPASPDAALSARPSIPASPAASVGSLGIGALKGEPRHE
ncbi:MAG TPA: Dyp-type peroxidase [Rhodopila sp.]|nr:Dyp-type peroxidase [Rhodopila sp.]HVZ10558.1 Dyp-type peroxidase [Rhodopila sp.]